MARTIVDETRELAANLERAARGARGIRFSQGGRPATAASSAKPAGGLGIDPLDLRRRDV